MRQLWYTKAPLGYWVYSTDGFKEWRAFQPTELFSYEEVVELRKLKFDMDEDEKYRSLFA